MEKTIIKGADDIRWGIDIRGGVDVTFCAPADIDPTEEQMAAAESIIKLRLVNQNITDYDKGQGLHHVVSKKWIDLLPLHLPLSAF